MCCLSAIITALSMKNRFATRRPAASLSKRFACSTILIPIINFFYHSLTSVQSSTPHQPPLQTLSASRLFLSHHLLCVCVSLSLSLSVCLSPHSRSLPHSFRLYDIVFMAVFCLRKQVSVSVGRKRQATLQAVRHETHNRVRTRPWS